LIINRTKNAKIFVGFCLNTHNPKIGYFENNCVVCLNINNGYVFCPSTGNVVPNYVQGKSGMLLTVLINTIESKVNFIGDPFTISKKFSLQNNQKNNICFCVSLNDESDEVTLIEN
jgi:hypothetical protein